MESNGESKTSITRSTNPTYVANETRHGARTAILQADASDTLLTYALLVNPDPLQVSAPGTFTLVASNSTSHSITCSKIVVTLPVGTSAKDVITRGAKMEAQVPADWDADLDGGIMTLTPNAGGVVGAQGVVFTIATTINDQPGTARIEIEETAAMTGSGSATRSAAISVPKFPVQFSISGLVPTPPEVAFGGSSQLMWSGSPATYTIEYPGSGGAMPVQRVGPFNATNLTIFPAVFTLTAKLSVVGQDEPLVADRQATVMKHPALAILEFDGSKTAVAGADTLELSWEVQMATSLGLRLQGVAGSVDVTGLALCNISGSGAVLVVADANGKTLGTLTPPSPVPPFLTFVLSASAGRSTQRRVEVEVLPVAITRLETTYSYDPQHGFTYYIVWATSNAGLVTIQPPLFGFGSVLDPSGQAQVEYLDRYTLAAQGFGSVASAKLIVKQ